MPYAVNIEGIGEINVEDDATDLDILQNALIAKMQAGQVSDHDAQLSYLEGLVEQGYSQQPQEQPIEPVKEEGPDRGYFMEAMAGIGSGALHTLGAGMSGLERLAERADIDPTGADPGWLRQAGEALKSGGEQIKSSPDLPDWYFKLFNAFGSVLGFTAPAVIAAPLGGLPSLAISGALGIGAGADEAFTRAEAAGATEEQIDQSTFMGGAVGLTEIAAPMKMLQRVAKVFPNVFRGTWQGKGLGKTSAEEIRKKTTDAAQNDRLAKMVGVDPRPFRAFGKRLASSAGLEASQEAVAAIAQNAISRYMYAPDTDLVDMQVMEEGLYGGSAGAMMEGVISAFSARKSKRVRQRFDKFTESDTYKEIKKAADEAGEVYDNAEEGSTAKQTAAEKIVRADAMMEGALLEEVWGSQDAVDYLKAQKGPNGERLYSDRFFAEIDGELNETLDQVKEVLEDPNASEETKAAAKVAEVMARERRGQRLKDLYIQHTNSPNTKYEAEAEEILYETVNPATRFNYTFDEIAEIKKRKKGIALEGEVKARVEDFNRNDPWQVQQTKIDLRMNHRASRNRLNEIQEEHGNQTLEDLATIMNTEPSLSHRRPTKAQITGATGAGSKELATLADLMNESNFEGWEVPGSYADRIRQIADVVQTGEITIFGKPDPDPTPTPTPEPAPERPDVTPGDLPTATAPITETPKQTATNVKKVADDQPGGKTGGQTIATPPADVTPGEGVPDDAPTDDTPDPTGQEVPTGTVKKAEIGETGVSPEDIPTAFNEEQITVIESGIGAAVELELNSDEYTPEFRERFPVKSAQEFIDDVKANPTGWQDTPKYNWKQIASGDPKYMAMKTIVPKLEAILDNAALRTREQLAGQYPDLNWNNPKQALFDGWINNPKTVEKMAFKANRMYMETDPSIPHITNESNTKSTTPQWSEEEFATMARAVMTMVGLTNTQKGAFEQGVDEHGQPSFVWTEEGYDVRETRDPQSVRNVVFMTRGVGVKAYGAYGWSKSKVSQGAYATETTGAVPFGKSRFPQNKFHTGPATIYINVHALKQPPSTSTASPHFGMNRWQSFLNTTYHEALHAAKDLIFTPEQRARWDELITIELASENDVFGPERQEAYEPEVRQRIGTWKALNIGYTPEQLARAEREIGSIMQEEAQTHLFGAWAAGKQLKGITPEARRLMEMIREFTHKFGNFMKGSGYVITCLLYTSPSPRDGLLSRMPSSA